jgi:hypothetical protein
MNEILLLLPAPLMHQNIIQSSNCHYIVKTLTGTISTNNGLSFLFKEWMILKV